MNDMIELGGQTYQDIAREYNNWLHSHIVRLIFEDDWGYLLTGIDDEFVLQQNCAAIEAIATGFFSDEALAIYNDQLLEDECFRSIDDVRKALKDQCLKLKTRVNEIQNRKGFESWLTLRKR